MTTYVITVAIHFVLFTGWYLVQEAARRFARRHPELGPAREEGGGCAGGCGGCGLSGSCASRPGD
ncbi:MAG: hypothetical protein ACLFRJ_01060 [Ectothiorhodospira sp.]